MKSYSFKALYIYPYLLLFYVLAIIILHSFVVKAKPQPKNTDFSSIPAVIAFGDSILDTGNNNYINTALKANFEPYGRDFVGGKPTGRFSNGRILSDFYAQNVGVKELLPPYLDPNLKLQDLLTGVNFASAGSGYDPLTNLITSVISLEDQVNLFEEYKEKLKIAIGEENTTLILGKSIFILSMGTNDVLRYFMTILRRFQYDVDEYTSILVNLSSHFLKELHQLGARRIGVLSLPALGCFPVLRTVYGDRDKNCVESINKAVMTFNSKLFSSLEDFNQRLPDSRHVYHDIYFESLSFIQHPSQFEFEVMDKACCGILQIEVGPLCNHFQLQICKDASKYVFWDAFHFTEKSYKILCSQIFKKNYHKFF